MKSLEICARIVRRTRRHQPLARRPRHPRSLPRRHPRRRQRRLPALPPQPDSTIGRAARNVNGVAILYADKITDSMKAAIDETERRREKTD